MKTIHTVLILCASIILFESCLFDARTKMLKKDGITAENMAKGRKILDQSWKKHGGDKFSKHDVYSFNGFDTWKENQFGKIGKLWPDHETNLKFKFQVGTLESQLIFLDGQREGIIAGISDAQYYEIQNGEVQFQDRTAKSNLRVVFGLNHIQYFFELMTHLRNASIISYAGSEEFNGNQYDLVFCTWGKPEPHLEHEQYVLWINQETGFMDYSEYSVRDPYTKPPGYKAIGGNIEYNDYREIDGVWIAHDQIVYPLSKKTDQSKFVHRLKITDFQFDSFDLIDLKK